MQVTQNNDNSSYTITCSSEQWQCLLTALQVTQYYSSGTLLELTEQLSEQWPHIQPSHIKYHVDDVIDSIYTSCKQRSSSQTESSVTSSAAYSSANNEVIK